MKPIISEVRRPGRGEHDFFKCLACGKRFSAVISLFPISKPKCPECGSRETIRDTTIIH